ncbi:PEP/pyruvate-binding domain-containing protein [Shigella flexneri]
MRSSATAEDMPDASFAGQQETFLNVQGFDAVFSRQRSMYSLLCLTIAPSLSRARQGYHHRGVRSCRCSADGALDLSSSA